MSIQQAAIPFAGALADYLAAHPAPARGVELFWLGQAGFLLRSAAHLLVIDPYLSDSLAEKYRGRPLPHRRMMAAPIAAQQLGDVQHVLVTHHHSDHLDGATLQPLMAAAPTARLIAPRAALALAAERSQAGERLQGINAGEQLTLAEGLRLQAVRASHETLEQDDAGNFRFLGYVITLGEVRIFHAGDTVPFDGQVDELKALNIDVALLPVNGRSVNLRAQGVPGNLTLAEGQRLCQQCNIRYMIAHHYGLFDFNTADPAEIDAAARRVKEPSLIRARLQTRFYFASPLSAR
ncbi:hypothetical protein BTJ39_17720 [Izhakiella australiensis]|uniref:Metallo-beta-lactamase domain-containing protein n=1 Tax=Izhakiella australiensis TaxID=1926881 RepID=A0A1S8YJ05_9GAMM|nr:MBL fold metallo-hydrolase [Izhakiella australiensis]OON38693.1 hypothetical protein BTJ39_17720 [Izhakiella australiensis]